MPKMFPVERSKTMWAIYACWLLTYLINSTTDGTVILSREPVGLAVASSKSWLFIGGRPPSIGKHEQMNDRQSIRLFPVSYDCIKSILFALKQYLTDILVMSSPINITLTDGVSLAHWAWTSPKPQPWYTSSEQSWCGTLLFNENLSLGEHYYYMYIDCLLCSSHVLELCSKALHVVWRYYI